jgi:uncharacterized protein
MVWGFSKRIKQARTWRRVVVVALALLSGCAYIETRQGDWIFNPVQGDWRGFRGIPAGVEEVWIPVGNKGEKIHAWWSPHADTTAPQLLYLHGARWNLSGSVTRIPRWNEMGFSVLAIDYRGFGKSVFADAVSPTEQSANEDAEAAWNYLVARNGTAKGFVFGHSLGCAMAVHLALKENNISGLVLEGAFTSIPEMISETKWGFLPIKFLVTQRFDNLARIAQVKVPILFAHGTADSIVPLTMGERLYAASKAPRRFLRAEGGTHHNLAASHFEQYRQAVLEHFGLGVNDAAKASFLRPEVSSSGAANAP